MKIVWLNRNNSLKSLGYFNIVCSFRCYIFTTAPRSSYREDMRKQLEKVPTTVFRCIRFQSVLPLRAITCNQMTRTRTYLIEPWTIEAHVFCRFNVLGRSLAEQKKSVARKYLRQMEVNPLVTPDYPWDDFGLYTMRPPCEPASWRRRGNVISGRFTTRILLRK